MKRVASLLLVFVVLSPMLLLANQTTASGEAHVFFGSKEYADFDWILDVQGIDRDGDLLKVWFLYDPAASGTIFYEKSVKLKVVTNISCSILYQWANLSHLDERLFGYYVLPSRADIDSRMQQEFFVGKGFLGGEGIEDSKQDYRLNRDRGRKEVAIPNNVAPRFPGAGELEFAFRFQPYDHTGPGGEWEWWRNRVKNLEEEQYVFFITIVPEE